MFRTHTPYHAHLPSTRLVRFLAIAIVFAMGAAFVLPTPAAAQVGASLSGAVVDLDGAPIADAEVVAKKRVNGSLWSYHETLTSKDGTFAFDGLEPGTWEVTARLDGYRTNHTTVDLTMGANDKLEIRLTALTERIYSGTILSGEDETPISGANITVAGYGDGTESERSTTSAEDGTFTLRLYSSENRITVTKSGFGTYHDWVYQPSGIIERTLYLHPVPPQSATVTGTVVDADGNPVQAYINLFPVYDDGCCMAYPAESDGDTEPAIAPAPDRASSPSYYGNHNSTTTGTDGTFTMNAYPGQVTIQANRQGYLVAEERVTLEEDGTQTVTLTLVKLPERTVTITGVVKDEETGEAIQGASVHVQVPGAGDHAWASTDADGKFTLTVRHGYTIVEVNHWGYCCIAYDTVTSSDDGDQTASSAVAPEPYPQDGKRYHPTSLVFTTQANGARNIDVALPPRPEPETTVVGYVLDGATGEAVAGAHVSLQNHATGDWGEARTDQNGSYKFLAHGGYHSIRIWVDGYLPYSTNLVVPASGSERADFEITAGEQVSEGWWSPDGHHEDSPGPRPMPASGEKYAGAQDSASSSTTGAPAFATDGDTRSAESPSGTRSYTGSGGGLPAYDPAKKDETFGNGESQESPVSPLLGLVFALGALAVVAGLRRER